MAVMKIQDPKKCIVFNEKNAKLKLTGLQACCYGEMGVPIVGERIKNSAKT